MEVEILPKWKGTNIGDTPIFHWTMIMEGIRKYIPHLGINTTCAPNGWGERSPPLRKHSPSQGIAEISLDIEWGYLPPQMLSPDSSLTKNPMMKPIRFFVRFIFLGHLKKKLGNLCDKTYAQWWIQHPNPRNDSTLNIMIEASPWWTKSYKPHQLGCSNILKHWS